MLVTCQSLANTINTHMYIYIYTHIYIHTYVYMYIQIFIHCVYTLTFLLHFLGSRAGGRNRKRLSAGYGNESRAAADCACWLLSGTVDRRQMRDP